MKIVAFTFLLLWAGTVHGENTCKGLHSYIKFTVDDLLGKTFGYGHISSSHDNNLYAPMYFGISSLITFRVNKFNHMIFR